MELELEVEPVILGVEMDGEDPGLPVEAVFVLVVLEAS